jgi:hypothetical protein
MSLYLSISAGSRNVSSTISRACKLPGTPSSLAPYSWVCPPIMLWCCLTWRKGWSDSAALKSPILPEESTSDLAGRGRLCNFYRLLQLCPGIRTHHSACIGRNSPTPLRWGPGRGGHDYLPKNQTRAYKYQSWLLNINMILHMKPMQLYRRGLIRLYWFYELNTASPKTATNEITTMT